MSAGKRSKLKVPIVKSPSQSGTRIGTKVEHDIFEEEALEALKKQEENEMEQLPRIGTMKAKSAVDLFVVSEQEYNPILRRKQSELNQKKDDISPKINVGPIRPTVPKSSNLGDLFEKHDDEDNHHIVDRVDNLSSEDIAEYIAKYEK
ncbi:uncharacterized protein LOC131880606 [Tigriopus californicus]|uniref:uncharacterized protein LOC131880606 n=1 Tax=Tigriopus californicus TaxID=6832 RepID=UPI0027D9D80B|nr:uncharacterized protein LOC131880606 [Tigriopus californicus]|eukprot:TCALIF_12841-PA protein Name:"Protein of unknown function" AED:0.10 eAED:0.10 QI:13/1/0.66/1/1/1/3/0/147